MNVRTGNLKRDINEFYSDSYCQVLNTGAVGFVSNLIHKKLEQKAIGAVSKILELGAGSGQHLPFVKQQFKDYFETDLRIENIPTRRATIKNGKVRRMRVDAENLANFQDSSFDRIVANCLLAHLSSPERALLEWRRVVKHDGKISFYVPCEPGLFLRIARYFTTSRKAKRIGLNHASLNYKEHIQYYLRLDLLIREVFQRDELQSYRWPFRFISWNFNFGSFYYIQVKKK